MNRENVKAVGGSALTLPVALRAAAHAVAFPDRVAAGGGFQVGKTGSGNDALYGVVMGGQNYRNKSKMYGALPPSFNPTVFSLFPDARRVLHLFSGSQTAEQVSEARERALSGLIRIGDCGLCGHPRTGHAPGGTHTEYGTCRCACDRAYYPEIDATHVRFDNALHPAAKAAEPDVIGDAERLSHYIVTHDSAGISVPFDLVIADPPYALSDQRRYWRESMRALPGRCSICLLTAGAHEPRYQKSTHAGALIGSGTAKGEHELVLAGYVRFRRLDKKVVLAECAKVLRPGGWLAWLDVILPHFATEKAGGPWIFRGGFSLVRSTGHRVRWTTFLERRA